MRIAVFGGTGGTGLSLIEQSVAAEDKVTALVRRPEALGDLLGVTADKVEVIAGDVLDPDTVRTAVAGADTVCSALGIGMHRHATTVYSQGTANIMAAMSEEGIRRLLVVSTASLEVPSPKRFTEWFVARMLHKILAKPYADMELMEQSVQESDLDWTLVRAARLTKGPVTGKYRTALNQKLPGGWSISKADVAHYMLAHVSDEETVKSTVEIAY